MLTLSYLVCVCRLYNGNTVGQQFGPKCCRGDRIGCGLSFDSGAGQLTVFFTKNGKEVSIFWSGDISFVCLVVTEHFRVNFQVKVLKPAVLLIINMMRHTVQIATSHILSITKFLPA